MDTRYQERTRGVTLTLLNLDSMIEELTPQVRAAKAALGVENVDQLRIYLQWDPYAIAEGDGVLHVVNHEGVIVTLGPDDKYPFNVYVAKDREIALFPDYTARISPDEIRAMATGEQVDLADHVRTFGGRLEDNFRICYDAITGRH